MTLYDDVAEVTVVACAIDNAEGSALAHGRLEPGDFNDSVLADLFAVTPGLPTERPEHATMPGLPLLCELRADEAARLAGVQYEAVQRLLGLRAVMSDVAGTFAARVAVASAERDVAERATELLKGVA